MGGKTILERVDRDGVHGQLMGCPEHSDGDFLAEVINIREIVNGKCK